MAATFFESAVASLTSALAPRLLQPAPAAARVAAGVAAVERAAQALAPEVGEHRAAALELVLRSVLHERLLDEVRAPRCRASASASAGLRERRGRNGTGDAGTPRADERYHRLVRKSTWSARLPPTHSTDALSPPYSLLPHGAGRQR
jgi:hypothetical protein